MSTPQPIPNLRGTADALLGLFGLHAHNVLNGGDPWPSFPFGWMRQHDMGGPNGAGVTWFDMEKSPGVFDFSPIDPLIDKLVQLGSGLHFVLNAIPTFFSQQPQFQDPYGNAGTGAPPADAHWDKPGRFLLALIAHCIARGLPASRIRIEIVNEPTYTGHWNGTTGKFWWGTAAELVRLTATVKAALVAGGYPNVPVLSAGFDTQSALMSFMTTTDPVTGKTGAQACDGICVHVYRYVPRIFNPPQYNFDEPLEDLRTGTLGFDTLKTLLAGTAAANKDIYVTEWGIDYYHLEYDNVTPSRRLARFNAQSPRKQADYLFYVLDEARRIGFKGLFIYAFGGANLSGDLVNGFGPKAGVRRFSTPATA